MEIEWTDRIGKLEKELEHWKVKWDTLNAQLHNVRNYLLEEFGFDIETKYKNGEKSSTSTSVKPKISQITFSTGNEEIDISKLRGLCMKKSETKVNDIQSKIFSLPSSTEVIEIVKSTRPHVISSSTYPDLILEEIDEEGHVLEDGGTNNEGQEIHQTQNVDYAQVEEVIIDEDDDDDDSAFPLSIYDLEGDEDLKLGDDDDENTTIKKHETLSSNSINDENDSEMYKIEQNSNNDHNEEREVEFSYTSMDPQNESQFYETEEINTVQNNASTVSSKRKGRVVKVSEPGKPLKFQCMECSRTFSDRGNGHRHVRRIHPGKTVSQIMAAEKEKEANDDLPPLLEPSIKLENPELGRLTHEQRKAASKLIRRVGTKWECKRCQRTFSVSCNARRHARVIHFGERLYSCGNCSKLFSSKTDGVIHEKICRNKLNKIREEEKKRGLQLEQMKFDETVDDKNDECAFQVIAVEGNLMDDEDELINGPSQRAPVSLESIANRKRDGKLICKLCLNVGVTSQFDNSTSFSHHAFYAHKKRVFEHKRSSGGSVCPKCSRNFGNETNMQAHYLACMKRAKPVADTTRTALLTSSSSKLVPRKLKKTYSLKGKNDHLLSQGMIHKIEEGEKPYFQCRICRGTYENLQSAFTHAKRMHLTIKPHWCTKCPKSYFNKKDFLKHQMKCLPISNEEEEEPEVTCINQPIASTSSITVPASKVTYGIDEVLDISEVNYNTTEEQETEILGSESSNSTTTIYPFNFLGLSQTNELHVTQPFNFDLNNIISITEIVPQIEEYDQQSEDFRNAVINNRNNKNNSSDNYSQPEIRKQSLVLDHEGF